MKMNSGFEIGRGVVLKEGRDLTLVASGYLVSETLKAADLLATKGISARVCQTCLPLSRSTGS